MLFIASMEIKTFRVTGDSLFQIQENSLKNVSDKTESIVQAIDTIFSS